MVNDVMLVFIVPYFFYFFILILKRRRKAGNLALKEIIHTNCLKHINMKRAQTHAAHRKVAGASLRGITEFDR